MLKEEVLKYLQKVPKWKVVSYKFLAEKFQTHPRAVAVFMKYNHFPDIFPCYKVLAHSGNLSWYSWVGWVSEKIRRLEKDGIIIKNWKVDKRFFYNES